MYGYYLGNNLDMNMFNINSACLSVLFLYRSEKESLFYNLNGNMHSDVECADDALRYLMLDR